MYDGINKIFLAFYLNVCKQYPLSWGYSGYMRSASDQTYRYIGAHAHSITELDYEHGKGF